MSEEQSAKLQWNEITNDDVKILASLKKVDGIVLTQDCDCLRCPSVSFMRIIKWEKNFQTEKNWMEEIVKINTQKNDRYYLPVDSRFKISERKNVAFDTIFQLDRLELKKLRNLRSCRLNSEALDHFRWKIAHYFKRYSYSEYYPLSSKEMDEYIQKNADSEEKFIRRKYQEVPNSP